ncbi:MAG: GTP-binding protein, partial [bacterium]
IISANTEYSHKVALEQLTGAYSELIISIRNDIITILAEVEASIDFPEEEIDPATYTRIIKSLGEMIISIDKLLNTYDSGRIIREGYKIAIAGRPNAGKSSLFNLLLQQQRALVTPTAGTTRDYLSEWIDIGGVAVNIIDTAGLRQTESNIEKAGQEKTNTILKEADLILWLFDLSNKNWKTQLEDDIKKLPNKTDSHLLLVGNKIDLLKKPITSKQILEQTKINNKCYLIITKQITLVSCKAKKGISDFKKELSSRINLNLSDLTSGLVVTSARHQQKLKSSLKYLKTASKQLSTSETPELIAFTLNQAINQIDEITGKIYNEEILGKIFSTFCLGK